MRPSPPGPMAVVELRRGLHRALCASVIDRSVLCSEEERRGAGACYGTRTFDGGAPGLAFAGSISGSLSGKSVAIVLCGSAISTERIADLSKSPQK